MRPAHRAGPTSETQSRAVLTRLPVSVWHSRSCGGRGKVCALALAADAAAAFRSTIDGTDDERFLERDAALEGRVEA